jgi:hypothetical protein
LQENSDFRILAGDAGTGVLQKSWSIMFVYYAKGRMKVRIYYENAVKIVTVVSATFVDLSDGLSILMLIDKRIYL